MWHFPRCFLLLFFYVSMLIYVHCLASSKKWAIFLLQIVDLIDWSCGLEIIIEKPCLFAFFFTLKAQQRMWINFPAGEDGMSYEFNVCSWYFSSFNSCEILSWKICECDTSIHKLNLMIAKKKALRRIKLCSIIYPTAVGAASIEEKKDQTKITTLVILHLF